MFGDEKVDEEVDPAVQGVEWSASLLGQGGARRGTRVDLMQMDRNGSLTRSLPDGSGVVHSSGHGTTVRFGHTEVQRLAFAS